MARKSLLGHKVRRLRRETGLSQVAMAERLGISPSYLNLIEHNQRPLTLPLVLKISRLFKVDLQRFSDDEELRLVANLEEVFGEAPFRDLLPQSGDLQDLASAHPDICRGLVSLFQAYREAREHVQVLRESLSGETFLSTSSHRLLTVLTSIRSFAEILHDNADLGPQDRERFLGIILEESDRLTGVVAEMLEYGQGEGLENMLGASSPVEEVTDLLEERENFFPELEDAAAALRQRVAPAGGDLGAGLLSFAEDELGIAVERARPDRAGGALVRFDEQARRLLLSEALPPESARFQLARHVAAVAARPAIEALVEGARLGPPAARALGAETLAKYVAGAMLMPYDAVLEAASSLRHDIEMIQHRFGASFEQVCHRLTTLRRAGAAGVPFHFVRVDIAGNVSKRFSGAGMRMPRFGGSCPRWNVHAAFTTPGVIRVRSEQLPDGSVYLSIARSECRPSGGHGTPRSHLAIGIGCDRSYAGEIVYADGLDLDGATMPIGITCRLCEREDCAQRAFPHFLQRPAGAEPAARRRAVGG